MTIPARAATPALLQVGAILTHLNGPDAEKELGRYLVAEFPHFRSVRVVDARGEALPGAEGSLPSELRTLVPETTAAGRARLADPLPGSGAAGASVVIAPVRDGRDVVGALVISSDRPGAFDGSDVQFATAVATRLGALFRHGRSLPTL